MSLRIDRAELEIVIKNDSSRTKLREIEDQMRDIRKEMRNFKKDSTEWNALNKQLQGLSQEYDDVYNSIGLVNLSTKELRNRQKELNAILQNLPPTHPLYNQYRTQLDQVNGRLRELRGNAQQTGTSLNKMSKEMGDSGQNLWEKIKSGFDSAKVAILGFIASISFDKVIDDFAELDDAMANVRKYTNMTSDDVKDLNADLQKIDTRTSRIELNELAAEAGRLGIQGKENILDFAEAANILNVALGEDLGEGAVKQIGKLAEMFGDAGRLGLKQAMLSTGSAINEVAQNSSAAESYLVDFTNRLSGVANQAGISISQLIGLGSVLDQNAQQVETSATALSGLIMKIYQEPAKFAKIAGLDVTEFAKKVKEDANGALLTLLETLGKKGGLTELAPIFKDMNLNGARASGILSVLAGNIESIRKEQETATKAFQDGTSVINEYNVQNNTFSAQLDKAKKVLQDYIYEIGERLSPYVIEATGYIKPMISALSTLTQFLFNNSKAILTVVGAIAAYNIIVKIQNGYVMLSNSLAALSRIRRIQEALATTQSTAAQLLYNNAIGKGNILVKAYIASTYLLAAAKALLTGKMSQASAAMSNFQAIMKVNPYVLLLIAIPLVFKGIALLNEKVSGHGVEMERLKEKIKNATEATNALNQEIAKEQTGLTGLLKAIINTSEGTQIRKDLIADLKKEYPDLLKYIDTEKLKNEQLYALLRMVNEQYEKRYELAALQGLASAEDKEIESAKSRQIQIKRILNLIGQGYTTNSKVVKEYLDKLNEGNGWFDNDIDTVSELNSEYDRLGKVVSKSMTEVADYRKEMSSLQNDMNKVNTKEGLQELLNRKSIELQNQRESVEMLSKSDIVSEKSKKEAIQRLKQIEAEYDILSDKLAGVMSEPGTSPSNDSPATPSGKGDKTSVQREKINKVLKDLEEKHSKDMAALKKKYADGDIKTEYDYQQESLKQQDEYDTKRKKAIRKLLDGKSITDAELRINLTKELSDIEQKNYDRIIEQNKKIKKILLDADPIAAEKEEYNNRLRELELFGETQESLTEKIAKANTDKEKEALTDKLAAFVLLENKHKENLRKLDSKNAALRLKELATQQSQETADLADQRDQRLISEQEYKDKLLEIELKYLREKLKVNGLSADKIEEINKQVVDKQRETTENRTQTRESVVDKYALESPKDKYQKELDLLKYYEEQNVLTHEEAMKAKQQLDVQYFDNLTAKTREVLSGVGQIFGNLSSMYSDQQSAAESAVERRYKKEIAAAGNNSKKVAKLEEKKEAEIQAIRAKYADKQFILSVAQVISSTSVAAMEAYKAMAGIPVVGPALGAAAAAAALAAGYAQIQTAKEQHEAAKKGYQVGGFTGSGNSDSEEAGVVHKNEFVANADAVRNPEVKKFLDIFDLAQKNGTIRMLNTTQILSKVKQDGYQSGGYTPSSNNSQIDTGVLAAMEVLITRNGEIMKKLSDQIDSGIYAVNQISGSGGLAEQLDQYEKIKRKVSRG
ncbi:phage tail tape measure protein [Dysgonomonas capnocytophagoides]|uniref:Phage tail tape measure protein n=1 Tax=Dysgonomonas capnocytophagoides TaxID=45254 RepID=A0A4Y8KUU2_9BACT|nr:phage tail tape measure protein [Dysgonomonas capnocytophagoides]TFD92564.1 phage tail tape measure protein [Dysgonomonas capnocytophagoides]